MDSTIRTRMLAGITIAAWTGPLLNALPQIHWDTSVCAPLLGIAMVGTLMLFVGARAKPVHEVYSIGYDAGRRQGQIDALVSQSRDSVVPFRSRSTG